MCGARMSNTFALLGKMPNMLTHPRKIFKLRGGDMAPHTGVFRVADVGHRLQSPRQLSLNKEMS